MFEYQKQKSPRTKTRVLEIPILGEKNKMNFDVLQVEAAGRDNNQNKIRSTGVRISQIDDSHVRFVLHKNIGDGEVDVAIEKIKYVIGKIDSGSRWLVRHVAVTVIDVFFEKKSFPCNTEINFKKRKKYLFIDEILVLALFFFRPMMSTSFRPFLLLSQRRRCEFEWRETLSFWQNWIWLTHVFTE